MTSSQTGADAAKRRCQQECKGRCCRYITIQISAPRLKMDFEEVRWFLAHRDISVYVASRRWNVEVRNRCKYLNSRNLCDIYDDRPEVCRNYNFETCEYPERPKHTLQFDAVAEFDAWYAAKRRREKRRRKRPARGRKAPRADSAKP